MDGDDRARDANGKWRWESYEALRNKGVTIWDLIGPDGETAVGSEVEGDKYDGDCVAVLTVTEPTRERIAACLNACEGIPTDKLVSGEAVTKQMAVEMMVGIGALALYGSEEAAQGALASMSTKDRAQFFADMSTAFDGTRATLLGQSPPAPMTRAEEAEETDRRR